MSAGAPPRSAEFPSAFRGNAESHHSIEVQTNSRKMTGAFSAISSRETFVVHIVPSAAVPGEMISSSRSARGAVSRMHDDAAHVGSVL